MKTSLTLNEYQNTAQTTSRLPDTLDPLTYLALGLSGEVGEYVNKLKKWHRDSDGFLTPELKAGLSTELGDILWYLAMSAAKLDMTLEELAQNNIVKIRERKLNGTIQGEGEAR